jgi:hypothetical protein
LSVLNPFVEVPQEGNRVDVTKSFDSVFAKTLKVSDKVALQLGPDC